MITNITVLYSSYMSSTLKFFSIFNIKYTLIQSQKIFLIYQIDKKYSFVKIQISKSQHVPQKVLVKGSIFWRRRLRMHPEEQNGTKLGASQKRLISDLVARACYGPWGGSLGVGGLPISAALGSF